MKLLSTPLVRYLAPLLMGYCAAAAIEAPNVAEMLALIAAASVFGLFSFPIGARIVTACTKSEA